MFTFVSDFVLVRLLLSVSHADCESKIVEEAFLSHP